MRFNDVLGVACNYTEAITTQKGESKLIKCPECGNDLSASATACPKCGHPNSDSPPPVSPTKKVSHMAGWLSLAAFLLASFTPALLAPVFVLAGLAFAAKELTGGGKVFGTAVLCLSLLQGWFVLDHFGQISASLGITTAKDVEARAVDKYAAVSLELPSDWRAIA
jgi:zinc-ribbon domain